MSKFQRVPSRRGLLTLQNLASKWDGDLLGDGEPEPVVVGIDASLTNFGLTVFGVDSKAHTSILFKPKYKGAHRLMEIFDFVTVLVNLTERNFGVVEYVMENYSMGSKSRAHAIGEGGGAVKLALVMRYGAREQVAYPTLVSPQGLKKYITGKGNTEKSLVIKKVWQKWGADLDDDNQADSYGLARLGEALLLGTTEHAYEAEVVAALERNTEWVPPK